MKVIGEFAFPEEATTEASALAISDWLRDQLERLPDDARGSATLVLFHGDAANSLRLVTR